MNHFEELNKIRAAMSAAIETKQPDLLIQRLGELASVQHDYIMAVSEERHATRKESIPAKSNEVPRKH